MKAFAFFAFLLGGQVFASQMDLSAIKNDNRYDVEGPMITFQTQGQTTQVRYVDACLAGDQVQAVAPVCLKTEVGYVAGQGHYVGNNCTQKAQVTVARPVVVETAGCVSREWQKVRENTVGTQGQYDWVCTKQGMVQDAVPTQATLVVKFYKEGRFESNGAPKAPTQVTTLNYTLPNCK